MLPASFLMGFVDLLAYTVGLSGFLFLIAIFGQKLVDRLGVTIEPEGWFRRTIGALFIIVGVLVFTGVEARIEAWLLDKGFDATRIEQFLLGAPQSTIPSNASQSAASALDNEGKRSPQFVSEAQKSLIYRRAPELVSPDGYINTGLNPDGSAKPITIGEFKGNKVVLIDIWTYSCINCQRTLPYLKAWYERYSGDGLEIIGVHTPEFSFERRFENVEKAVKDFGLKYPVVLDNEYKTWNAFGNRFWPRKYLIDIDGYIVYDHAGEGNYDEAEHAIQNALAERAARLGKPMPTSTEMAAPSGVTPVSASKVRSPEIYFGSDRNEYLGNGEPRRSGEQTLSIRGALERNILYLSGRWNFSPEYAENLDANSEIRFRYSAKNVYLVASAEAQARIKVTRDGVSLGSERGEDVGADGMATIREDRLYKLIEGTNYGEHTIEIVVENSGVKAFTFTFG